MFGAIFLRQCAVSSGSLLRAHMIYQGSTLQLTQLSRMEYPTIFSWTSPLPFWVNIFTDHAFIVNVLKIIIDYYHLKALIRLY